MFRDRVTERRQDGPKLVYICAPLRGEVEKNIAFAREKRGRCSRRQRAHLPNHAERLGIPVLTDQKELGKPRAGETKQGKER